MGSGGVARRAASGGGAGALDLDESRVDERDACLLAVAERVVGAVEAIGAGGIAEVELAVIATVVRSAAAAGWSSTMVKTGLQRSLRIEVGSPRMRQVSSQGAAGSLTG